MCMRASISEIPLPVLLYHLILGFLTQACTVFNRNSTSAKFLTANVLTDRVLTLLDNGVIEVYKYSTSEVCGYIHLHMCMYVCMYELFFMFSPVFFSLCNAKCLLYFLRLQSRP